MGAQRVIRWSRARKMNAGGPTVMTDRTRQMSAWAVGAACLSLVVAACGASIPPGAQQVHVVGTHTEVRLDPSTVHAGDVYFVMEGSVLFFQHAAAVQGEQSGPMSEEELTRLAQNGDPFHTSSGVLSPGYAGNFSKFTLRPGKYAFLPVAEGEYPGADLMAREQLCYQDARACAALPPLPMTVLEVLP
jgi:hypothetical protein